MWPTVKIQTYTDTPRAPYTTLLEWLAGEPIQTEEITALLGEVQFQHSDAVETIFGYRCYYAVFPKYELVVREVGNQWTELMAILQPGTINLLEANQ